MNTTVTCECVICSLVFEVPQRPGSKPQVCSKECFDERGRRRAMAWYIEHRDDEAVKVRQVAAARRSYEKMLADSDLLAQQRARMAAWRSRSAEKMREQERRWREANRGRVAEKHRRRRARLLAAYVEDLDAQELWLRDWGICALCQKPIDPSIPWPNKASLTIDHIIPLAKGGTHEMANAQLAHAQCNSRKGDRYIA